MIKIENNTAFSTEGNAISKRGTDAVGIRLSAFGCNESDFEEIDDIVNRELSIEAQERINELEQLLAASDYKAIKYAEGWYSEEEYAPIREYRQGLRDEINALQAQSND